MGPEGLRMGQQGKPLSHVETWMRERWPPPLTPQHLQQVGNLIQPLTSCSPQENRPSASHVQPSRVDPVVRGMGETVLSAQERHSWYCLLVYSVVVRGMRKRCPLFLPLLPLTGKGADPCTQHWGKQTLHLVWAAWPS